MENNENKVRLGDGVWETAKTDINGRTATVAKNLVGMFFDYLDQKVKDLPETIRQLKNNPETTQEIVKMWSEDLFSQGLIPCGYAGLSDELIIHNFRQEGYLDGLYAGYALALTAMDDKGVQEETIIEVRDALRSNLLGHSYEERAEFTDLLKDEKYEWINKEK